MNGFVLEDWEPGKPILDVIEVDGQTPVVTEAAMAAFVAHWRSVDPNGIWGQVSVVENGGRLCLTRSDSADPDDWSHFPAVGPGNFAIAGWGLVPLPG